MAKVRTEGSGRQGVQAHATHPDHVLCAGDHLVRLQHLHLGFDRFKLRAFSRPHPGFHDPQDILHDVEILFGNVQLLLGEQQLVERDLYLGGQVEVHFLHAGAGPSRPRVRRELSGGAHARPFERLVQEHRVLTYDEVIAGIPDDTPPSLADDGGVGICAGCDLLASALFYDVFGVRDGGVPPQGQRDDLIQLIDLRRRLCRIRRRSSHDPCTESPDHHHKKQ